MWIQIGITTLKRNLKEEQLVHNIHRGNKVPSNDTKCQKMFKLPKTEASAANKPCHTHLTSLVLSRMASGVAWGELDMWADINGWKIARACQLERKLSHHSQVVVRWSDAQEKTRKPTTLKNLDLIGLTTLALQLEVVTAEANFSENCNFFLRNQTFGKSLNSAQPKPAHSCSATELLLAELDPLSCRSPQTMGNHWT